MNQYAEIATMQLKINNHKKSKKIIVKTFKNHLDFYVYQIFFKAFLYYKSIYLIINLIKKSVRAVFIESQNLHFKTNNIYLFLF